MKIYSFLSFSSIGSGFNHCVKLKEEIISVLEVLSITLIYSIINGQDFKYIQYTYIFKHFEYLNVSVVSYMEVDIICLSS